MGIKVVPVVVGMLFELSDEEVIGYRFSFIKVVNEENKAGEGGLMAPVELLREYSNLAVGAGVVKV